MSHKGVDMCAVPCGDASVGEKIRKWLASQEKENVESFGYPQRLAAFHKLSRAMLMRDVKLDGLVHLSGAAFLASFLDGAHLESLIRREIPHTDALERFVRIEERKSIRLVRRGTVCHWLAGNVPLLGAFSWALSALVGNRNILRLSSRQDDVVTPIMDVLSDLDTVGRRIAAETLVVRFDRDDSEGHRAMSQNADVRIAWGGREAIETVRSLPCPWHCEDVLMGPRASIAVIDAASITEGAIGRLATDVVFFDQMACSSPQLLFVRGRPGHDAFDRFLDQFSSAIASQSGAYRRHRLDASETYQIELDRARVVLSGGELRRDANTQWTIALVSCPVRGVVGMNRFVQVVPFESFRAIWEFFPANLQTCIVQLGATDLVDFTERAALLGVCRFPLPGEGNHFEVPWDGSLLVSRFLRWVTRTDPAPAP